MANTETLDLEVQRLTDDALLKGADVADVNSIRTRYGYPAIQEVPVEDADEVDIEDRKSANPFIIPTVSDDSGAIQSILPEIGSINKQAESMKTILPLKQLLNPEVGIDQLYRQTVAELSNTTPDNLLRQITSQIDARVQASQLQEIYNNAGIIPPEDLRGLLQDFQTVRDYAAELNPTLKSVDQLVEGYSSEGLDDFIKRNKRSEMYMWSLYAQEAEKVGQLETVQNWLAEAFLPDNLLDMSDLTGNSMFSTPAQLKKFIGTFQLLDPIEKEIVIEQLLPKVWEAYDNNHVAVSTLLGHLYSPYYESAINIDIAFDALAAGDAVALAKTGVSAVKGMAGSITGKKIAATGLKKGVNTSSHMNELGNSDIAAGQNIIDSADGVADEVTKAKGVSKEEALNNMSPFTDDLDTTTAGRVPGLSSDTIRIVEESTIVKEIPELLSEAGNKLTKGEVKNLRRELKDLEFKTKDLEAEYNRLRSASRRSSVDVRTQTRAIQKSLADMNLRKANIQNKLLINEKAEIANAALTRIEQGLIPEHLLQPTITEIQRTPLSQAVRDVIKQQNVAALSSRKKPTTTQARVQNTVKTISVNKFNAAHLAKLGAPNETIEATKEARSVIDTLLEEQIKVDLFKAEEITRAVDNQIETLKKQFNDSGKLIKEITPTEITQEGFTARVTMEDGVTEQTFKFTKDVAGHNIVENTDFSKTKLFGRVWSPEFLLSPWNGSLVEDATFLGQQAARMREVITTEAERIYKGLSKSERVELDQLVLASDNDDTIFSYADLLSGNVQLASGMKKYSANVADAYYRLGSLMEDIKLMADNTIRRSLELDGFKEVRFINGQGGAELTIGKPYDSWQGVEIPSDDFILDINTNKYVRMTFESRTAWQKAGKKPIRLLESRYIHPQKRTGEGKLTEPKEVRWAVMLDEGKSGRATINSLPNKVLNGTEGLYIPRSYQKGYHYIRDMSQPRAPVIGVARTAKEAEAFIKKAAEAAPEAQVNQQNLVAWADGEFSQWNRLSREADNYGGLYVSPRKKMPLQVTVDGQLERLERMSAADSIQRYINAQSEMASMAEYRIVQVQRFKNTANELARRQGLQQGLADPTDFHSPLTLKPGSKEQRLMEQTREYLNSTFRLQSADETAWESFMTGVANFMEGKAGRFGEMVKTKALDIRSTNPIESLRAATFFNSMGWYNLRQLFVQAQNAALAMSMYPIKGLAAAGDMMLMRIGMYTSDEAINYLGKLFGKNDLLSNIKEFKDSGLLQSIKRNADLDSVRQGITGNSLGLMRQVARTGLIFYEEGELASRLISWNIAKRNLFGVNTKLTKSQIVEVSQEAVRMHMNMQRENAAWWQRSNVTALPLQFTQVQAKIIEKLMPKILGGTSSWTAREKFNVFMGQFVLYGAVGVPVAEDIMNYLASTTGKSPEQLKQENPNLVAAVTKGMYGVAANSLGFNNDFSTAGSILAGIDDNSLAKFAEAIIHHTVDGYDNTPIAEAALGATGTTLRRIGDAAGQLTNSIQVLFTAPTVDNLGSEAIKNLDSFAAITATWSNARKVWQIDKNGGLQSNRGRVILDRSNLDQWNFQTRFARMWGFQTLDEARYYASRESKQDKQKFYNESLDALIKNYRQLQLTGDINNYRTNMALILDPYTDNAYDRNRLMIELSRQILTSKTQAGEQDRQFLKRFIQTGGQDTKKLSEEF